MLQRAEKKRRRLAEELGGSSQRVQEAEQRVARLQDLAVETIGSLESDQGQRTSVSDLLLRRQFLQQLVQLKAATERELEQSRAARMQVRRTLLQASRECDKYKALLERQQKMVREMLESTERRLMDASAIQAFNRRNKPLWPGDDAIEVETWS